MGDGDEDGEEGFTGAQVRDGVLEGVFGETGGDEVAGYVLEGMCELGVTKDIAIEANI